MDIHIPDTEEQTDTETDLKEPSMYKVLLHNDDYTTMEFVVEVLMFVFNKPPEIATGIMMNVHRQGIGVCGVYTHDVAETKVNTVHALASERGFPLRCSMEEYV
jgi:ATP-dependent Clp protease adaptor protein ClpS